MNRPDNPPPTGAPELEKAAQTFPQDNEDASKRRILQMRAQTLAAAHPPQEDTADLLELVEFELGAERYAFELLCVREVVLIKELTPVPGTPAFVLGIINLRGEIRTVVDLRKFFGLPDQGGTGGHRILVIHGAGLELAVVGGVIRGVRRFRVSELQFSATDSAAGRSKYLLGTTSDGVAVLNAAKILSDDRIIVHDET